jgi:hypothetical protein
MRRRPPSDQRRKLQERPPLGKRVIKALLTLPGFEPAGRHAARNSRTGETIAPVEGAEEPSGEHGTVIVTAADGGTNQMPAHHCLVDQLARVHELAMRAVTENTGAAHDDGRRAVKNAGNSRKATYQQSEGGDRDTRKRRQE